MKKLFKEFKAFISKGSVINLAVGIIIGGAFTAIVTSLVNDMLMPLIALLGGKDITEWKWVLQEAVVTGLVVTKAEIAIRYGLFLQAVINFLLIALTLFIILKITLSLEARALRLVKRNKVEEPTAPVKEPEPSAEIVLLTEIRDALVKK